MTTTLPHPSAARLCREDLHDDPYPQFVAWLDEAARSPVQQPLAATLTTVGREDGPLARTVLIKYHDARGLVFFTDLQSRKVRQMTENPQVSLLFPWLAQNRQVGITGRAERLGGLAAVKCFLLGQHSGVTARVAVEMQLAELTRRFGTGVLPLGASWGGYRVVPDSMEFFQGYGPLQHDRFLYVRKEPDDWEIEPLD